MPVQPALPDKIISQETEDRFQHISFPESNDAFTTQEWKDVFNYLCSVFTFSQPKFCTESLLPERIFLQRIIYFPCFSVAAIWLTLG